MCKPCQEDASLVLALCCTDDRYSMPLHTLLTDVIVRAVFALLGQILNRVGACVSADTQSQFVQYKVNTHDQDELKYLKPDGFTKWCLLTISTSCIALHVSFAVCNPVVGMAQLFRQHSHYPHCQHQMVYSHFVNSTLSILISSTSHFINPHFVNSHLVNVDKVGIDKVGIDEVGGFTISYTSNHCYRSVNFLVHQSNLLSGDDKTYGAPGCDETVVNLSSFQNLISHRSIAAGFRGFQTCFKYEKRLTSVKSGPIRRTFF